MREGMDGECSEWFEVKQGVRQGCPMSPWLFNIFLDMVIKEVQDSFQRGVYLDICQVQILSFADDTVLVAENEEDLKHNIKALQKALRMHKLASNWGKTDNIVISRKPMECNIEIKEHSVKSVNETVYICSSKD